MPLNGGSWLCVSTWRRVYPFKTVYHYRIGTTARRLQRHFRHRRIVITADEVIGSHDVNHTTTRYSGSWVSIIRQHDSVVREVGLDLTRRNCLSYCASRSTLRYLAFPNTKLHVALLSGQFVFTSGSMALRLREVEVDLNNNNMRQRSYDGACQAQL
jgi:hypothetical protein